MKYQGECEVLMSNVESKSIPIPNDVEYCGKSLETLQISLENDAEAIAHAKTLVTQDAVNAELSFKVIHALKTPQQFHHFALWHPNSNQAPEPSYLSKMEATPNSKSLVSYFSETADNISQTLNKYKTNIAEVETYLRGLEANLGQQVQQMAFVRARDGGIKSAEDQIRELAAVLREFETGILGVAGKVGSTREKVQELILGDYGTGSMAKRF
jgi:nucleoporin p58/p45